MIKHSLNLEKSKKVAVCDSAQAGPDIHFFRMLSQKISPPPTSPIIWSVPEGTNFRKAAIEFTKLSLSLFVIIIFFVEEEEGYHRQKLFFCCKKFNQNIILSSRVVHLLPCIFCILYQRAIYYQFSFRQRNFFLH